MTPNDSRVTTPRSQESLHSAPESDEQAAEVLRDPKTVSGELRGCSVIGPNDRLVIAFDAPFDEEDAVSGKQPCSTCGATYGQRIADRPDRCGVCITGLSLDGRAIYPVERAGKMTCPTCSSIGANCKLIPHDEWPGAWAHDLSHLFPDDP